MNMSSLRDDCARAEHICLLGSTNQSSCCSHGSLLHFGLQSSHLNIESNPADKRHCRAFVRRAPLQSVCKACTDRLNIADNRLNIESNTAERL